MTQKTMKNAHSIDYNAPLLRTVAEHFYLRKPKAALKLRALPHVDVRQRALSRVV